MMPKWQFLTTYFGICKQKNTIMAYLTEINRNGFLCVGDG